MAGRLEGKVAFITGTTGQDGSYLVEALLAKGECLVPDPTSSNPLFSV